MQLVRQIQMKWSPLLDEITFLSKNLFNVATYTIRQRFFFNKKWIHYTELWDLLKDHDAYQRLKDKCGSHAPQQVLKQVDHNFKSYFEAIKVWKVNPSRFTAMPKLPHSKRKDGRNLVYFTRLQCRLRHGEGLLTQQMMKAGFPKIPTDLTNVKGVRVVPFGDRYNVELIYDYIPHDLHLTQSHILAIDLGLTNIVSTSDNIGQTPLIIKGGILKSINQYYNKELAKYKSLVKKCNGKHMTNRILKLHRKRNNKVHDFFHKTSRKILTHCIEHDIGTIIIGYNEGWKQNIHIGKRQNQNFVSIPFLKFLHHLEYKCEMVGIDLIRIAEDYTSQTCSQCGVVKKSNRKHRGLYVCSVCGSVMNADVNASKNILHKGIPESLWIGDRGRLDRPEVLKIT